VWMAESELDPIVDCGPASFASGLWTLWSRLRFNWFHDGAILFESFNIDEVVGSAFFKTCNRRFWLFGAPLDRSMEPPVAASSTISKA
jgi:hypothetical protein